MLGLSVGGEPGSAADFELVTRLEKLILANQTSVSSTLPVDHAFSDHAFSDHASTFRRRRTNAPSTNHRPDDVDEDDDDDDVPDSSRSYEGQRTRSRSRSLSPMRSRDPNVY